MARRMLSPGRNDISSPQEGTMKKSSRIIYRMGISLAAFALCGLTATIASATPSTQIWIPSTDIQPYKTVHLNFEPPPRQQQQLRLPHGSGRRDRTHRRSSSVREDPGRGRLRRDLRGGDGGKYPFYGHFKLGTPEDSRPALPRGRGRHVQHRDEKGDVRNGGSWPRTRTSPTRWSPRPSRWWAACPRASSRGIRKSS